MLLLQAWPSAGWPSAWSCGQWWLLDKNTSPRGHSTGQLVSSSRCVAVGGRLRVLRSPQLQRQVPQWASYVLFQESFQGIWGPVPNQVLELPTPSHL